MKKIFVVDEDKKFQTSIKSLCDEETVELHLYTSSIKVLPLIESVQPDLIFVNLELSDIDDFVMYDLMKKADMKPPVPVLITYTEQSEKDLQRYKKVKFRPEGYHKKPLSDKDIATLLTTYLGDASISNGMREERRDEPSENENIDVNIDIDKSLDEEEDVIFNGVFAEAEIEQEPLIQEGDESDLVKKQVKSQSEKRVMELEKKLKELENEKMQIEATLKYELTAQKERNKKLQQEIDLYKNKNEQLGELLQKAVSLTQDSDKD
jgi:CheY-like chemotaxis protein